MRSHVLEGTVRHRRVRPFDYDLRHSVWYLALDVDEIAGATRRLRLLGRNGRNLLAFHDRDHLEPPADDVVTGIRAYLAAEGVDATSWRISLVANARVLGYVFDPASFWLCHDASGVLQVVVVEVHNTFHERHLYTLRRSDPADDGPFSATMDKAFYVSPFLEVAGGYVVRVRETEDALRIAIDHADRDGGLLYASLALRRRPLTDRTLLRMLLRHPLVTHKTIAAIHLHAVRLWRRGAAFHRHGAVAR
jgi:DUF1365 family protein